MKGYRVCSKSEAEVQQVGKFYRIPSTVKVVHSAHSGFHATLVPEHWRRILNHHMCEQGLGSRYTHTLLLEIPDDSLETISDPLPGMEYRLEDVSRVIVRGIAGPQWPVPDWVPQPRRAIDWEPESTQWSTKVCKWQPK